MRVSELQKQLTDYLVNYGDDQIFVAEKPELERPNLPFEIGPSDPKEGFPRVAVLDVPPSIQCHRLPAEPGFCVNTCSEDPGEKKASEEPGDLERILKEITSSGPASIEIRVSL